MSSTNEVQKLEHVL